MSKPKEYSWMTKDKLMIYTFGALLILTILAIIMWYPVTEPSGWNLGLTVGIVALIAVGVAVGLDTLISKVASDATMNTMSAAVFGLIVTLSYSLGAPIMSQNATATAFLSAPDAFLYVAIISTIGLVIFKKLLPRKYVNPAAAAKLLVLLPFFANTLLAKEHFEGLASGGLGVPILAGPIGGGLTPIGGNGLASFATYLQQCYSFPSLTTTYPDTNQIMILEKFHGWVGGASSLAVIIVGIALFVLARRFIKWRITVAYFVSIAIMSVILSAVYADADFTTRLVFEVFIGSSIFLGFFMATDPASTPLTYSGQAVFGVGLGVLTVLIQTYMNFFGGSILALVVMNLVSPLLDGLGKLRPTAEKKEPKLPKAEQFTAVKVYQCIRCGACMRVCCHQLSPILIKEAFDKTKVEKLAKLQANLCDGCGHCSFVCPSRIDLKGSTLRAKVMLRAEQPPAPEPKSAIIEAPKAEPSQPPAEEIKTKPSEVPVKEEIDRGHKIIDSAHGRTIEGIGPVFAEKFNSIGIYTTSDLLEAGATPLKRKELADKTGISDKLILRWLNIADLLRIEGVGEKYADLLEESGVDTVVELSKRVPGNLHAKLLEVNEKKKLVQKLPTLNEVKQWIEEAKKLPRKIEY